MTTAAAATAVLVLGVLPLISSAPELRRFARDRESQDTNERNCSDVTTPAADMLVHADSRLQFSCTDLEDGVYMNPSSPATYYRSEACHEAAGRLCCVCRCENGSMARELRCEEGQVWSAVRQACCAPGGSDATCVQALCTADWDGVFAMPGSRCRAYYRCHAGRPSHHVCPHRQVFIAHAQECVQSGEPCYEPLCTGRVNGEYPDTSHGCQRSFLCEGGSLRAVRGCPVGNLFDGHSCQPADGIICPPPEATAVALPRDDCAGLADGPHTSRDSRLGCRAYRLCRGGRTLATLHWGGDPCLPDEQVVLPSPPEPCAGQPDGPRADYSAGCSSYVRCSAGAVVERLSCGDDRTWNGSTCVAAQELPCEGPQPWVGCAALADGVYADLSAASRCRHYFTCHGGNRTRLACSHDKVFDGRACVPADLHHCPERLADSCEAKPDGYYHNTDSGCRSYYFCSNGHKITYLCSGSYVFDGSECVHPDTYECPFSSKDCVGRANGYHPDTASRCRKYFYCLDGDKITTLVCADDKVFDGHRCVEPPHSLCSVPENVKNVCRDKPDGWFADFSNGCRKYFQCIDGRRATEAVCPDGKVFDGSSCVDSRTYSGCLALESTNKLVPSLECTNTVNGFYQNITSGCKSYYYCIDGMKTTLYCPGNQLFNGQLCVNSNSYTCPVPTSVSLQTRTSHSIEYKHVIKTNYQTYTFLYIFFFPLL